MIYLWRRCASCKSHIPCVLGVGVGGHTRVYNAVSEMKQRRAVAALGSSCVRPYPIYRHGPHFTLLASSIKDQSRQKAFDLMTANNEKLVTFAQQHIMRAFRVRSLIVKRWRKKQKSSHGTDLPNMAEDGSSRSSTGITGDVDSAKDGAQAASAEAGVIPSPTPPPKGHQPRPKFTRAGRTLTKAQAQSPMVESYLRTINQTGAPAEEEVRQAQEVVVGHDMTGSVVGATSHSGGTQARGSGVVAGDEVAASMDGLMTVISRFHRRGAVFRGALP